MIRIKKASTGPQKLREDGKRETEKNNRLYEQYENDFKTGRKKFKFDSGIYGHQSVKEALKNAQHQKCCFCERKEEIGDVEHFRPKGSYQQQEGDALSPTGYYWLAYEWSNLFFACPKCNRSYKRNFFPLADDTKRALSHTAHLADEDPLFIDPQRDDPECYIEFVADKPRAVDGNQKGKTTIEKTGIDRLFLDERRFQKYQVCKSLYLSLQVLQNTLERAESTSAMKQQYEAPVADIQRQLDDAQKDKAEFASMIRCALKHKFRY